MRIEVLCPAKINLFLSVGPPDDRGYHPIRTVFQAVSLFDRLVIEEASSPAFECDWPGMPAENTVTKALRFVAEAAQVPPLKISLFKSIPAESGLGGGSSDAAGLLRGIGHHLPAPLPPTFVRDTALAVGADVPFFLIGGRARATGYGEVLEPLPDAATEWYVIVRPPVGVSTGAAYQALDSAPREWREFGPELYNDFERVAPCECLDLTERLQILGARGALLSGSGSAVFGVFDSEGGAQDAADRIRGEGYGHVWVVRSLGRGEPIAPWSGERGKGAGDRGF